MKYFLLLLLVVSCSAQKATNTEIKTTSNKNNAYLKLVLRDYYSGLQHPQILVIKEPSALKEFYAQINKTRKPGLAMPNVDFNKETVLVYCLGEQLNAGLPSLAARKVLDSEMVISSKRTSDASNAEITSSPFCVYIVKEVHKEFSFVKN